MAMSNDDFFRKPAHARAGATNAHGPVIDQDGREIPREQLRPSFGSSLGDRFQTFRFDFGHSGANPFGDLTREQRLARLGPIRRALYTGFVVPRPQIPFGVN